MRIQGSQMLVNPTRTNETVGGTIATPNISQNMGIETNFAKIIEENAYKYQELRDNEQFLGSESGILEGTQDSQSFQLKLKTDPNSYKKPDEFNAYTDRHNNRKETYLKMAKENGYKEDIVNATIERMDREYEQTKAIYGKYVLDYRTEESRKNDYIMADERAKTMSQIYLNGNVEQGNVSYKENGNALWNMYKKDNLSVEQFTTRINKSKQEGIYSQVMSFTNIAGGEVSLAEMSKYTFKEFQEHFKELQQKFGDYDVILDSDDFSLFQRAVNQAVNVIETKKKADEQATLYEATKQIQYRKENNFAIESKKYPSSVQPWQIGQRVYIDSTNNFYGTKFRNLKEASQLRYQIKIIDDSNSQEKFYNDIEIDGVNIINKNLEETQMYVGGWTSEDQRIVTDGMAIDYHNRGVTTRYGYNVTKQLQNAGSETSNFLVRTYTPESRKILKTVENVNLNFTGNFNKYKDLVRNVKSGRPVTSIAQPVSYAAAQQMNYKEPEWGALTGEEYENDKYTDLSVIGTIEGLEYCAKNGDVNSKATSQDLKNMGSDLFKLMVMEKTGGVLSEDIAEDLGMKTSAGLFITDLTSKEQKEIFNYILQNDDDLKEEFVKVFEPVAKEILGDTKIGDAGNGRFVRLEGIENPSKELRGLNDYMRNNDFIAIVGKNPDGTDKTKIVKGNEIVPVSTAGKKEIIMAYNKNPVILNGGVAVYRVGGMN